MLAVSASTSPTSNGANAVQLDRDDRSYEAEDEVTALSPQLERRCEWSIY